jgi:hypothetical protein
VNVQQKKSADKSKSRASKRRTSVTMVMSSKAHMEVAAELLGVEAKSFEKRLLSRTIKVGLAWDDGWVMTI